jgi:hypothetical protein
MPIHPGIFLLRAHRVILVLSVFTAASNGFGADRQRVARNNAHADTRPSPNCATNQPISLNSSGSARPPLPSLPNDVAELEFDEFFQKPVGPLGLQYSDKLNRLNGRKVRILGYMVKQSKPVERTFLFSPRPIINNEQEYGLADDLPASTVHVFTTAAAPAQVPFTPGPLLLTGTLSLGNCVEADGRTSTIRLHLDPPTPEQLKAAHDAAAQPAHDSHSGHGH